MNGRIDNADSVRVNIHTWGFPGGSAVKKLPAVQGLRGARAQSLGGGGATRSSALAWRTPGTEEPGGLQSMRSHRAGPDRNCLAYTYLYKF